MIIQRSRKVKKIIALVIMAFSAIASAKDFTFQYVGEGRHVELINRDETVLADIKSMDTATISYEDVAKHGLSWEGITDVKIVEFYKIDDGKDFQRTAGTLTIYYALGNVVKSDTIPQYKVNISEDKSNVTFIANN